MPEVTTAILRDIFFLWFYVTVTRLKEITRKRNPITVQDLIDDLRNMGSATIVMDEKNQKTVEVFHKGILNNKGFADVRRVLANHPKIVGRWPVDPPHPTGEALKAVFIPPASGQARRKQASVRKRRNS